MRYVLLRSPVGKLLIAADPAGLRHIRFDSEQRPAAPPSGWRHDPASLAPVVEQLEAYFAGKRRRFDLELAAEGTEFQLRVWAALLEIPYGETASYRDIAERLGDPAAVRAVGAANGSNPLPIVVPCHRVIGSDGSLVGYGGGLDVKRRLLALEQGHGLLDFADPTVGS